MNTNSQLLCSFNVSSVSFSSKADIFFNITKRREKLLYTSQSNPQTVSISSLSCPYLETKDYDNIEDFSKVIQENNNYSNPIDTLHYSMYSSQGGGTGWIFDNDALIGYVLVTPIFTSEVNLPLVNPPVLQITNPPYPLFYNHQFQSSLVSGGSDITNVKLLRKGKDTTYEEIETPEILVDIPYRLLYCNLQNNYSSPDNFSVYYVSYTVTNGSVSSQIIEILNTSPVMERSTTYNVVEGKYGIEVPYFNYNYAIKSGQGYNISFKSPLSRRTDQPWNLRYSEGDFRSSYRAPIITRDPNTGTQIGDPSRPIGTAHEYNLDVYTHIQAYTDTQCTYLDKHIIKLPYVSSVFSVYGACIYISDKDNNGLYASVYQPLGDVGLGGFVGTIAKNGAIFTDTIESHDTRNAIVYLSDFELDPSYKITCDYYANVSSSIVGTEGKYTGLELNPLLNTDIDKYTYVLHMKPNTFSTLYLTKINKDNRVITSDIPGLNAVSYPLYYPTKPSWATQSWLPSGTNKWLPLAEEPLVSGLFQLARVTVEDPTLITSYRSLDNRVRGGGITTSAWDTARTDNPSITLYWDHGSWDGKYYPGQASYVVEVPAEILESAGGIFTHQQIKDVVARHTALGVYPVVRGYGVDTTVTGFVTSGIDASINIVGGGRSSIYTDIYISSSANGPWGLVNNTPILITSGITSYVVSGLTTGSTYYLEFISGSLTTSGTVNPLINQVITPTNSLGIGPGDPSINPVKILIG